MSLKVMPFQIELSTYTVSHANLRPSCKLALETASFRPKLITLTYVSL